MLTLLPVVSSAHVSPALTFALVSVGMLVVAAADIVRHEVEDYATALLLLVTVTGLHWDGISGDQWVSGTLTAAVVFLIYLALGTRGALGGGDVKLSVVPALLLGTCHPLLGLWWVAAALLMQHGVYLMARVTAPKGTESVPLPGMPHVPAMAGALLVAWVVFPT